MENKETALDELVHEQGDEVVICIGSHDGFFFCGTRAEYDADIEQISKRLKERMLFNAERNFTYFRNKLNSLQLLAAEGETPTSSDLKILIGTLSSHLKNTAMAARFKPVRDREIQESYNGLFGDSLKIIVEGDESGKFWDRDEYQKDKERREKKVKGRAKA